MTWAGAVSRSRTVQLTRVSGVMKASSCITGKDNLHYCSSSSSLLPRPCVAKCCNTLFHLWTSEWAFCSRLVFTASFRWRTLQCGECTRATSDHRDRPTPLMRSHDALPATSSQIWAEGEDWLPAEKNMRSTFSALLGASLWLLSLIGMKSNLYSDH